MSDHRADGIDSRRILEILERDRITPIREIDRRTGGGGARYILALADVINSAPELHQQLAEIDRLGLRYFELGADQARIIDHRMRGEEAAATAIEARVELAFVQLGSIWQVECFMPAISSLAYGLTRDMLGLRRSIEVLAAMCAEGFRHEPFLAIARGEYLRERGDPAGSRAELEPVAAGGIPMFQAHALPALAETLIVLGEHTQAREVARRGIAVSGELLHAKTRSIRALALAEAANDDHAAAAARLDAALVEVAGHGNPLLSGSLHEARARIALATKDSLAFNEHLAAAERHFRATDNQVLIARADRLAASSATTRPLDRVEPDFESSTQPSSPRAARRDHERERSIVSIDAFTTPRPDDPRGMVSAVLSQCRGNAERAARVLQLVLDEAHAASGYLFLRRAGDLVLAAPTFGDEPPTALRGELSRELGKRHRQPTASDETVVDRPASDQARAWRSIPLAFELDGAAFAVGIVAVFPGALPLVEPDPRVITEIARELFEAGDVARTHASA